MSEPLSDSLVPTVNDFAELSVRRVMIDAAGDRSYGLGAVARRRFRGPLWQRR